MYARSNKRKNDSFYYTSLQFLYWMMFCSVYGFATLFLIYFKIDPAKIGGILALVNIVSTVLQPFISQVIIKKRKIPLITVLKTMIAGLGVILLAGVLIPNLPIITYILGGILVVSMQSFSMRWHLSIQIPATGSTLAFQELVVHFLML